MARREGEVWGILFSGPWFTKRTDVLPQDLVKSRSREIPVQTYLIALEFDKHLVSDAAETRRCWDASQI